MVTHRSRLLAICLCPGLLATAGCSRSFNLANDATAGNVAAVQADLAAGANPNQKAVGEPPIYYAAANDHLDVLKVLIAAGADVNATIDDDQSTALMGGAQYPDVVGGLITAGAKTSPKDKFGDDALCKAIRGSSVQSAQMLVNAGSDLNGECALHMSPLGWAVQQGDVQMAEYLLNAGADPNAAAAGHLLGVARFKNLDKMVALLEQHGARN